MAAKLTPAELELLEKLKTSGINNLDDLDKDTELNEESSEADKHGPQIFERDDILDCLMPALIAGEHMLFIGPPGVAKSLMARAVCAQIDGASYFEHLMTRFSGPDEIFGPLCMKSLQDGKYRRLTEGYLPWANVVFTDEVFKANSAVLNAMLTVLNERKYHNDGKVENCPLVTCFAASNEYEDGPELAALRDRFLFTFEVGNIRDNTHFKQMLEMPEGLPEVLPKRVSLKQLQDLQLAINDVKMDLDPVMEIRTKLRMKNIEPTDRTWRKAVRICKASAVANNHPEVDLDDLDVLRHCLWRDPETRLAAQGCVGEKTNPAITKMNGMKDAIREVHKKATVLTDQKAKNILDQKTLPTLVAQENNKLKGIENQLNGLKKQQKSRVRRVLNETQQDLKATRELLHSLMGVGGGAVKDFS